MSPLDRRPRLAAKARLRHADAAPAPSDRLPWTGRDREAEPEPGSAPTRDPASAETVPIDGVTRGSRGG